MTSRFELREEPLSALALHAQVSIAFLVDRVLEVSLPDEGLGGVVLSERPVDHPYLKDYDADQGPTAWATRFDISNWGLIGAHRGSRRIGGAVIAWSTPGGVDRLSPDREMASLWDLRVDPAERGHGVGTTLFGAALDWAREKGCRRLEIETQTTNVAACHFYRGMGCVLGQIDRFAYPGLPEEVRLVWRKNC